MVLKSIRLFVVTLFSFSFFGSAFACAEGHKDNAECSCPKHKCECKDKDNCTCDKSAQDA